MRWILATLLAAVAPDLVHYLVVLAVAIAMLFLISAPPEERRLARL